MNKIVDKIDTKPIPEKCLVFGHTMYLQKSGPQFKNLLKYGIWEPETTEYFQERISRGDIVLDIGANIGYFTLIFASLVGNQGKVYSFEPELSNFKILQKNVITNNYNNVVLENSAVTNFTGTTNLYLSESAAGQHRIYESNMVSKNYVSVKTIKLDDYFNNIQVFDKISFIKIDVEGAEFGVLKGMKTILSQNRPLEIILEFSPQQIRSFGDDPLELLKFLKNYNFEFYSLKKFNQTRKKLDNFNEIINNFEGSSENILCKKE